MKKHRKGRGQENEVSNSEIIKKSIVIAVFATVLMIFHANATEINIVPNISPQPIEPGQDFVMSITLVNEGSDVKGVTLTVVPDSLIILKNDLSSSL